MKIGRGTLAFAVFAIGIAVGCVKLGFWQLDRLGQRRTANAQIIGRLGEAAVSLDRLPRNTTVRFRRATATGTYDFANEFVLTSRGRNGAPGVHVITPLRMSSTDTAVLVNRGWAYAPDGMSIDLALFREDSSAVIDGFVEEFSTSRGPVSTPSVARAVRRLDRDSIAARIPYPIAPVLLVQRKDSGEFTAVDRGTPVRAEPPPLDEGSHRAYAIQWFGFALVGLVGTALVVQRDRTRRGGKGHESVATR